MLLQDISPLRPEVMPNLLTAIHDALRGAEPGELGGPTKLNMQLDRKLDALRDTFLHIFEDAKQADAVRAKALLLIYELGVARGGVEDLLLYCDVVSSHADGQKLCGLGRRELERLTAAQARSGGEEEEKVSERLAWSRYFLFEIEEKSDQKLATDGTYLYLYMPKKGIFRLGSGGNNTLVGRVYAKNDEFKKGFDKPASSFFVLNGLVYLRNAETLPFQCFDANTLQERDYLHKEHSVFKEKAKSDRKEPLFFSDGERLFSLSTPLKVKRPEDLLQQQQEQEQEAKAQEEAAPAAASGAGARRSSVRRERLMSAALSESDSGSADEAEEKRFDVVEYDPDTEVAVAVHQLTDLDVVEKLDENFSNFAECQAVFKNGVLYLRKGEQLAIVDCEASEGKFQGSLLHYSDDLKESFGSTWDSDCKAIVSIQRQSGTFNALTASTYSLPRGARAAAPEENDKSEEKTALDQLLAATKEALSPEAMTEAEIRALLGLPGGVEAAQPEVAEFGKQDVEAIRLVIMGALAKKARESGASAQKNVLAHIRRPFVTQLSRGVFMSLQAAIERGLGAVAAKQGVRAETSLRHAVEILEAQIVALRECKLGVADVVGAEQRKFIDTFAKLQSVQDEGELGKAVLRLMSVSMELLYADVSDILAELKGILGKKVRAGELSTHERQQLCVIFDNLAHRDSIGKLLKAPQLQEILELVLDFSMAGVLEQLSRIHFARPLIEGGFVLLLSEKKAGLVLNEIQSAILREFGCVKNGEKRASEQEALLLPYTRALVKCVVGLLESMAACFERFYADAKADMLEGQIEQFDDQPIKLRVRKVWDLIHPLVDGQLCSHVLWLNLIFQALSSMPLEAKESIAFAPLAIQFLQAASLFHPLHDKYEEKDEVVKQYTTARKVFESSHPLSFLEEASD